MRLIRLLFACALMPVALLAGCGVQPRPGMAAAEVRVVARPKAGIEKKFVHVAVYDAAPAPEPASGSGQYQRVDYDNLSNIIIWLEPDAPDSAGVPAGKSVAIDLNQVSSDVIPVSVGQQIVLRNNGSHPLSPYSVSDGNDFDLKSILPGGSGNFAVRSPGTIEILVDPAKPPVAQLYAAPTPFVAGTESGRIVTFNNVPPGDYHAVSWHPRLPGSSQPLTLTAGRVTRCTLSVGVNNLPEAGSP